MDGSNNEEDFVDEVPEVEDMSNMVIVNTAGYSYCMDGYLKANLDFVKTDVRRRNYDSFILVVGREGYGKSTIAMQMALYLDPTFTVDRVVFTAEQFMDAVKSAGKYQAIVFDETMGFLSSRGAMSKFNRDLIKIMSEMRSKNLYVFLCIPSLFIMDWYPAEHRSTGMIYVYKRGCFGCYTYDRKKQCYVEGKKTRSYSVSPNFIARYSKAFPIDKDVYEKKKQEAINSWNTVKDDEKKYKGKLEKLCSYLLMNNTMSILDLASVSGVKEESLLKLVKKEKLEV
jgi:hypothetical protein